MNGLAAHYSRFRVADRLLLTGHSHQAWPDVARQGLLEAFDDAARDVDAKWEAAFAKAERVRDGFRGFLGEPEARLALAASTHELLVRLLSALELRKRPRLVTTTGEFHSARRQLARLAEEGVELVKVPTEPVPTLAQRLADAVDGRTSAVLVSKVLFETSRIVPNLGELASVCARRSVELVVDAYHALGAVPTSVPEEGLETAWILGGGYKYLQLGEGNCFLRLPEHADEFRPVVTGWFAGFTELADTARASRVDYPAGADRFAGATYDPASHYRAARVFDFFAEQGLTPARLRESYLRQNERIAAGVDGLALPQEVVARERDTPRTEFGGFTALRCADADGLRRALAMHGVHTDSRGPYLRLGPAPYLSEEQLDTAVATLGRVAER
ncbi:selenocysteine lyase/cysteine desulfurase [Saccharomonospora amisosensis]|uniref:Selenocysteine lyase/cysteine desulfurase n=1 Tax=Saccharomonospora amisosensis TaxID=1128677 RepID=A0A7X5UN97_9PSEU|nr:DegT/DnrJ/EryC1/StrS family aminotransferase [Saccharomonospora amisosensis]NIJ11134.1 selenocysteine lyase/cysteine desulfurase [Saccharomonospora amisosensis]